MKKTDKNPLPHGADILVAREGQQTHMSKKKRTRMIEVKMEVGGGGTNVNSVVGDGILENAQT